MTDISGQCSCDYDYDYNAEHPRVFNQMDVVSRKSHTCDECGESINRGENYERTKGLWDGQWSTYKTCILCQRIRADLVPCACYGELRSEFWELFGFDYVDGPEKTCGDCDHFDESCSQTAEFPAQEDNESCDDFKEARDE